MNYELAAKLKDAGLSQENGGDFVDADETIWHDVHPTSFPCAYIPTLSELIEACGEGRFLLEKGFDTAPSGLDVTEYWVAQRGMFKEVGSIPEEAVANLYLALYNKSNAGKEDKNG